MRYVVNLLTVTMFFLPGCAPKKSRAVSFFDDRRQATKIFEEVRPGDFVIDRCQSAELVRRLVVDVRPMTNRADAEEIVLEVLVPNAQNQEIGSQDGSGLRRPCIVGRIPKPSCDDEWCQEFDVYLASSVLTDSTPALE